MENRELSFEIIFRKILLKKWNLQNKEKKMED
jgi:hypothetical protein